MILENLTKELTDLRTKFPGQSRRFWKVISAATKRVIREDRPIQPAVLMFVSRVETSKIMNCLARKVMDAVRRALINSDTLDLNMHDLKRSGKVPDSLKLQLDNILSRSFFGGNKVALLRNIQALPSRCALLFHSYCDNENAPFKDVTIAFTLELFDSSEIISEEGIQHFLQQKWGDVATDTMISPLLSRITNNIAVVGQENPDTVTSQCP